MVTIRIPKTQKTPLIFANNTQDVIIPLSNTWKYVSLYRAADGTIKYTKHRTEKSALRNLSAMAGELGFDLLILDRQGYSLYLDEKGSLARDLSLKFDTLENVLPTEDSCIYTETEIAAIKCAYLDLKGALSAYEAGDMHLHDWKAHKLSIEDLETAFPFLDQTPDN